MELEDIKITLEDATDTGLVMVDEARVIQIKYHWRLKFHRIQLI